MTDQVIGVEVIVNALNQLIFDLLGFLPRLITALIIWYIGKYLLRVAERLIRKVDFKRTNIEDKAVDTLARMVMIVGKVVLVLVIFDYLGIGRTVVGAIANGLTFAVAIALGLAFGKALEEDATQVVAQVKRFIHK